MSWRQRAGALIRDWPRFLRTVGRGEWQLMHNRDERIVASGRGVRCEWLYTSDLHIAKVFPRSGAWLMRRALADWPVVMREEPAPVSFAPKVSFVIGHRGNERLPLLLATLRSIGGQSGVPFECIVVEQSSERDVADRLPGWVRYVHTPVARDMPYRRGAAFNAGARVARGEVLVLHDNDMLAPSRYASEIARAAERADFVDLKRFIFYLDEDATVQVCIGEEAVRFRPAAVVQNARGGTIAATRRAFFDIGGFDEEFVGWGGEDNDFWDRAETTGRTDRFGSLPMIHLFHPPQQGKIEGAAAPAVQRYRELEKIPPEERIRRLRAKTRRPEDE